MPTERSYRPGEICPKSGLYRLLHNKEVSHAQAVIPLTKGEKFPPCRNCTETIEWQLVSEAKRKN